MGKTPFAWLLGLLIAASGLVMVCCMRPASQGCIRQSDDGEYYCDYMTVTCYNHVDSEIMFYDNTKCTNSTLYLNDYGRNVRLIRLIYKCDELVLDNYPQPQPKRIPNFMDGYEFRGVIKILDMSQNNLLSNPLFDDMQNLVKINLSHNHLQTALLFNTVELKSLEEIDYSFNELSVIEVNELNFFYKHLRKLNFSHNLIYEIKDANFALFPKLEVLDMSYNNIQVLNGNSFEGIRGLLELDLSYNEIVDLQIVLFRFVNLRKIHLSHNKLEKVYTKDLEKLTKLTIIDLSFNSINHIENRAFTNLYDVTQINLSGNTIETINEAIFNNNEKLEYLDLSLNKIKSLPNQLFVHNKLLVVRLDGNKLNTSLVKGIFDGLHSVPELDLSYQLISAVEDYAFFGLEKLKTLWLNNNNISSISQNAFSTLRFLVKLDLSFNKLYAVNFKTNDFISLEVMSLRNNCLCKIEKENFDGMSMLRFLDISNNNVSIVEYDSFQSLANLINLDVFNNPIQGILEDNTFYGLNSLPALDLSQTMLTMIGNDSFSGMFALGTLNISRSNISKVDYNAFSNTGNIQLLDLSHNKLNEFKINVTDINELLILLLNYNNLESISMQAIQLLPRLKEINFSHNKLVLIDTIIFGDLKNLKHLDLSYNEKLRVDLSFLKNTSSLSTLILSGIKTNFNFSKDSSTTVTDVIVADAKVKDLRDLHFGSLKVTENLVLSYNDIKTVNVGDFSEIKKLKHLDLSFNKLMSIQPGSFRDNSFIDVLNVSHNLLTSINYGILSGLTQLNTLDISYNSVVELKDERFYEVPSLEHLIVDYNKINNIDSDEFAGSNLKILSIGGNPLNCEILIHLNKTNNFKITALKIYEPNKENIFGVTCNVRRSNVRFDSNRSLPESSIILSDIRDILLNISQFKYSIDDKPVNSMPTVTNNLDITKNYEQMEKRSNNLTESLLKEIQKTNYILENTAKIRPQPTPPQLDTTTVSSTTPQTTPSYDSDLKNANVVDLLKRIREEFKQDMAAEKKIMISEMTSLIESKSKNHGSSIVVESPKNDRLEMDRQSNSKPGEAKSQLFTETCVGLILLLLVGIVLRKFYNSRMFVGKRRRTASTRQIADAEDAQL